RRLPPLWRRWPTIGVAGAHAPRQPLAKPFGRVTNRERVRETGKRFTEPRLHLRDPHDVTDPAVQEPPGIGGPLRAIVQPIEERRAVNSCEQTTLGIEVEVGGGIPAGVPDGVDGTVEEARRAGRVLGKR